jgi:DNA-binding transcriptional LysR family regulator
VELTAVGRDFVRKARTLLDDLDAMLMGVRDVAANRWGQVTLACIPSTVHYFLPAVLRQYHARFPRIRVRIIDESANEVLSAVVHGEAELGLAITGSDEPTIDFEALLTEPFVAACHRDHPLARQRSVTWAELGNHDFMTVDKASGNRLVLDLALASKRERPQACFEVRHVSALVGFVESGLGVAAVPRLSMPRKGHPALVSVPLDQATRALAVAWGGTPARDVASGGAKAGREPQNARGAQREGEVKRCGVRPDAWGARQTSAGMWTLPPSNGRAVRTMPARSNVGCGSCGAQRMRITVSSLPAGCSIATAPGWSSSWRATACATVPGMFAAAPMQSAPVTAYAEWQFHGTK